MFQFTGRAGETVVAEVFARRLDSPLDSVLKITDASGKLLAYNDDYEDPQAGTNTHDADSYLSLKLPADGTYYVHLGDTARCGGEEYAYRLRIGPPQPDFALFCVPSSIAAAQQGQRPGERSRHPQGRVHRPHQARLERPAGRFLVRPAHGVGHADDGTARGEDHLDGQSAAREPRDRRPGEDRRAGKSPTRPCRRKTACRHSSGGIWFRRRT